MKKLLAIFATTMIIFMGCSSDSDSETPTTLTPQGNDETKSSETANNFSKTDTSSYTYTFSTRTDFSMENGYIKISQTENKTGTVANWVLSHDSKTLFSSGFEAEIKVNENMNYAAIRMNKKSSYDDILFEVHSDGTFKITQTGKGTLLNFSATDSKLDISKFNKIKARTCDSENIEVYVNGNLVKTFTPSDLAFTLKNTDKFGIAYNVKKTTSTKNPAQAWIKTLSLQNEK